MIRLERLEVDGLREVLDVLGGWQHHGAPFQLHPGDVGWYWRRGAEATAGAVPIWKRGDQILAIGLLDGADLLRLAISPGSHLDPELAWHVVGDVTRPEMGVLPAGTVYVESPPGALVHDLLGEEGWRTDEPWALLRRDLAEPVETPGVRVESIGPEAAHEWAEVHVSAFDGQSLGVELIRQRWQTMTGGLPYTDARSLVGYDDQGAAVAAVTVWSAGTGRYGVIEPMGVHRDHRGHGYGRAITLAAAAALQELGSSAAMVGTQSANVGAVATYVSAGFLRLPDRWDRRRDS